METKAESLELRAESPCPERAIVLIVIVCALMHVAVVALVVWFCAQGRGVSFPLMPRATAAPISLSSQLSDFRGLDPAAFRQRDPGAQTPAGGIEVVVLSHAAARRESRTRGARSAKGPRSRDWEPSDVRCQVAHCPCNRRGRCTLPSQIDIGPDGKCRKADEFKSRAAAKPAPVSGD